MAGTLELVVDGYAVRITNPDRVVFPATGHTKRDLVDYYLSVGEALMRACRDRPVNLERFPRGVGGPSFVQKRVPAGRPPWLSTVVVTFGSGRTAEELCPRSLADVLWAVNIGCISVHPWAVRLPHTHGADELRVDLDPAPDLPWSSVVEATLVVRDVLEDHGLVGFPKTSGSRGMHVLVRIPPTDFVTVRRAAVALAREAERRAPTLITTSWWREQRGPRVFVDYNQNLWDRTMACAYSVRPTPDARVSTPLRWEEVAGCDPAAFTIDTVPGRLTQLGDPMDHLDATVCTLDALLERAAADERAGLEDLPWPPHYPKAPGEPPRSPPSRRR